MKTKLIILLILTTMIHTNTVNAQHSQLKRADFQQTIDGKQTDLYFLRNKNGIEIAITNFGGRVVEFWTPDKKGHFEDIVLGHDHVDKYLHYKGERFLGATIGRYGNRINKGKFTLNGQTYQLPIVSSTLAVSNIRNRTYTNYEVYLIGYGYGKFKEKIHFME